MIVCVERKGGCAVKREANISSAVLLSLCPLVSAVLLLVRGFKRGKEKFSEDLWPRWRDALEEAIRKQERKAWEKRHPGQV